MYDPRLGFIEYFRAPEGLAICISEHIGSALKSRLEKEFNGNDAMHVCDYSEGGIPEPEGDINRHVYFLSRRRGRFRRELPYTKERKIEVAYSVLPSFENPRWIIPDSRRLGLIRSPSMINPSTMKARIGVLLFRVCRVIGIERVLFPGRIVVESDSSTENIIDSPLSEICSAVGNHVSPGIIYTGSYGPIQKFTVELLDGRGTPVAYAKIGHSLLAREAINREQKALALLATLPLTYMRVPQVITPITLEPSMDQALIQEAVAGTQDCVGVSPVCIQALVDLGKASLKPDQIMLADLLLQLEQRLINFHQIYLPVTCVEAREEIVDGLSLLKPQVEKLEIPMVLSHGDFTRWNIKEGAGTLHVFDWEEAAFRPVGHDLFNLVFSEVIQAKRLDVEALIDALSTSIGLGDSYTNSYFLSFHCNSWSVRRLLLLCYLADKIAYYMWHVEQHSKKTYPEKPSFDRVVHACLVAFRHFTRL